MNFLSLVNRKVTEDLISRTVQHLRSISSDVSPSDLESAVKEAIRCSIDASVYRTDSTFSYKPGNDLGMIVQSIVELSKFPHDPESHEYSYEELVKYCDVDYSETNIEPLLHNLSMSIAQNISPALNYLRCEVTDEVDYLAGALTLKVSTLLEQKADDAYTIRNWTMGGLLHVGNESFTAAAVAACNEKANALHAGTSLKSYEIPSIIAALPKFASDLSQESVEAITNAVRAAAPEGRYTDAQLMQAVQFLTSYTRYNYVVHNTVMAMTEDDTFSGLVAVSDDLSLYADLVQSIVRNISDVPEHLDETVGNHLATMNEALMLLHGALLILGGSSLKDILTLTTVATTLEEAPSSAQKNYLIYVHPVNYQKFLQDGGTDQQIVNYARWYVCSNMTYGRYGVRISEVTSKSSWVTERLNEMNEKIARKNRFDADDALKTALEIILNERNSKYRSPTMTAEEQAARHQNALAVAIGTIARPDISQHKVLSDYVIDMCNRRVLSLLYANIRKGVDYGTNVPMSSCSQGQRSIIFGVSCTIASWLLENFAN